MFSISFIVPSYNSHLTVQKTLLSIFGQSEIDRVRDVVVVDSSDDEKTRKILQGFNHPKLKLVLLNQKAPPSEGRNTGAKIALGDILCFIDSDVYLGNHWLKEILAAYQDGCRAGCGSVSAPDFQQDKKLALAQLYLQFNESLAVGDRRPVAMVPACNMFVERGLFEKAGGFPDLRASEDVVLCLKIGAIAQVWFVPSAECFHIFRENIQSYKSNQMVLGRYIIIYRRRMFNRWFYRGLWPVVLLPTFLIIKAIRIKMRVFKSGQPHVQKFIASSPLFALGLLYWAIGFLQGCFSRE